jgi:hypothetical protein
MTEEQKQAVVAVYGELCKKFKITPSTSTLRCHAWFTAGGTYLGDYNKSKSAKTCPGTNFMGFGNSKAAIQNNFIPMVKAYMEGKSVETSVPSSSSVYRIKSPDGVLNIRKGPGASYAKVGEVKNGEAYTIVKVQNNWGLLKSGAGWISLAYTEKVK